MARRCRRAGQEAGVAAAAAGRRLQRPRRAAASHVRRLATCRHHLDIRVHPPCSTSCQQHRHHSPPAPRRRRRRRRASCDSTRPVCRNRRSPAEPSLHATRSAIPPPRVSRPRARARATVRRSFARRACFRRRQTRRLSNSKVWRLCSDSSKTMRRRRARQLARRLRLVAAQARADRGGFESPDSTEPSCSVWDRSPREVHGKCHISQYLQPTKKGGHL